MRPGGSRSAGIPLESSSTSDSSYVPEDDAENLVINPVSDEIDEDVDMDEYCEDRQHAHLQEEHGIT
ncbi:hypothetical protein DMENIID0001_056570 [Sergentomyia squamirostris]